MIIRKRTASELQPGQSIVDWDGSLWLIGSVECAGFLIRVGVTSGATTRHWYYRPRQFVAVTT